MNNKTSLSVKSLIFSGLLLFLIGCSNSENTPQNADSAAGAKRTELNESAGNSMDTVPLAVAQVNIRHYLDTCDTILGTIPIRAYTVHANDMLLSLGIDPSTVKPQYNYARVYLGLDANNNFKLYFTPVSGADLKPGVMNPGTDVILKDEDGNGYVMDLNAPCPNTCDVNSPLYNPQ